MKISYGTNIGTMQFMKLDQRKMRALISPVCVCRDIRMNQSSKTVKTTVELSDFIFLVVSYCLLYLIV